MMTRASNFDEYHRHLLFYHDSGAALLQDNMLTAAANGG
jgi:hypothetical protein